MILGITGGSGAGKTTLLAVAQEQGFAVLDCDAIYHDLLERDQALLAAIEARFPGTVEQGKLRRKQLGAVVFADPQAMAALNAITHPAIVREVGRRLAGCAHAAVDAPLLFESGLDALCDVTVGVLARKQLRLQRLMTRDGISLAYAQARIDAQPEPDWYRHRCTYILENNGDPGAFRGKCLAFFNQLGIMMENNNAGGKL